MSYIVAVNPAILKSAGMPVGASLTATILAAIFGTLVMALYANRPFAIGPYMGENAFIAFTVVHVLGYTWQSALGAVFVAGVLFYADDAVSPAPVDGGGDSADVAVQLCGGDRAFSYFHRAESNGNRRSGLARSTGTARTSHVATDTPGDFWISADCCAVDSALPGGDSHQHSRYGASQLCTAGVAGAGFMDQPPAQPGAGFHAV